MGGGRRGEGQRRQNITNRMQAAISSRRDRSTTATSGRVC
ncbi:hypothetical protein AKJ08_2455 [Vulgatibacter incomptus]|uniref:Uncharacterized protein n=1 Tax=Vulgatibacter incomptus TaxID=1391653 RepID=A0A0K1PEW0_9BACT|nr:hypothetical protein AKJ08_2455 [Vulgatibacter incomptus]